MLRHDCVGLFGLSLTHCSHRSRHIGAGALAPRPRATMVCSLLDIDLETLVLHLVRSWWHTERSGRLLSVALLSQLMARAVRRGMLGDEAVAGVLGTSMPRVVARLHERLVLALLDDVALTGAQRPFGHAHRGAVPIGSGVFGVQPASLCVEVLRPVLAHPRDHALVLGRLASVGLQMLVGRSLGHLLRMLPVEIIVDGLLGLLPQVESTALWLVIATAF